MTRDRERFADLVRRVLRGEPDAVATLRAEFGGQGSLSDDVIEAVVKVGTPEPPVVYHHYFPGDGKAFTEDYDPASLRTGCGVPVERGHVMPELNHVTCEACLQAYRDRWRA